MYKMIIIYKRVFGISTFQREEIFLLIMFLIRKYLIYSGFEFILNIREKNLMKRMSVTMIFLGSY